MSPTFLPPPPPPPPRARAWGVVLLVGSCYIIPSLLPKLCYHNCKKSHIQCTKLPHVWGLGKLSCRRSYPQFFGRCLFLNLNLQPSTFVGRHLLLHEDLTSFAITVVTPIFLITYSTIMGIL